jgi:uracil-DNA glycosylase
VPPTPGLRWQSCLPKSNSAVAAPRLAQPLASVVQAFLQNPAALSWHPLLQTWATSAAGQSLVAAVDARLASGATIYPADVFRALVLTPKPAVRVVILGQDPYHGPGQAEGLAFSAGAGLGGKTQAWPPSLRNIFKELQRDLGLPLPPPGQGSLLPWAQQGVLLLNTSLTVEDGQAGSHAKLGWQALTDAICQDLWASSQPLAFMLWGAQAQARAAHWAGPSPHRVLMSNHPSPLSALRRPLPFMGCGHFGLANQHLQQAGRTPVDWALV